MNYISVESVSKAYGERVLFKDISLGINQGQKIGFVAQNGMGKTSLLNIIGGADAPDNGQVSYRKGLRMAFLNQEPNLNPQLSIEEVILQSDIPAIKITEEYNRALLDTEDSDAFKKPWTRWMRHRPGTLRPSIRRFCPNYSLTT
jgi:ATPase components of ABC transporters with duplicated ATPase domains